MLLVRLYASDGSWNRVCSSWSQQCRTYEEDFTSYATPLIEHARTIVEETPPHKNYGVFELQESGETHAILHANRAGLPGTTGWTLRLLWVLLAPRYDFAEVAAEEFARLAAGVIYGALEIARSSELPSHHIKIHLGNMGDHDFFRGVAQGLRVGGGVGKVTVRGNWLHMETISLTKLI